MKKNEYKCEYCEGVFVKGWSDEEADAEYKDTFKGSADDVAIVCDDCYKGMIQAEPPKYGVNYE